MSTDFLIEDGILTKYVGQDTEVIIPEGVTEIGRYAFGDTSIEKVVIPNTTTAIGKNAFLGCKDLKEIACEQGIILKICEGAFYGCESLESVGFSGNSIEEIESSAFNGCKSLADENGFVIFQDVLYDYFGEGGDVVIPEGVVSLDDYCFKRCNVYQLNHVNLKSVLFPKSLQKIGASSFENCQYLTEIVIPNSVTEIGFYAFAKCKRLKEVILSNALVRVGDYAFGSCSIEKLKLPKTLAAIGEGAFMNNDIRDLKLPDNLEIISNKAFAGQPGYFKLYVKKGSKSEALAVKYAKKNKIKIVVK